MRTYLFVLFIIVGLMGAYIALLPLTVMSDANMGLSALGPG